MLIVCNAQTFVIKGIKSKTHLFKSQKKLNMPLQRKQKTDENQTNNLLWTNDEMQLLLDIVKGFKSKNLYDNGIDWESLKDKYLPSSLYDMKILQVV